MKILNFLAVPLFSALPLFAGITVSAPANGAATGNPFQIVASGNSSVPVTAMQAYLDNQLVYQNNSNYINTSISAGTGQHQLVIQQWDANGNYAKVPMTISVVGSSPQFSPTQGATIWNIDQIAGWQSCDACAGIGGNGPKTPYSTTQFRQGPSLDGASMEFWIGGAIPYAQALWWKQLGGQPQASHFTYDVSFYLVNSSAPQALEFDVNQSVNGQKYIFGTQCNIRNGNSWDVWDTTDARWVNTGIYCGAPAANVWHHLTWQFERVNGQAHFVSVTLDGVTSNVNRYFWPISVNANELNVAFQLDGNYAATNYSVWLDKLNLNFY